MVAEDEPILAWGLAELVSDEGYGVVGPVGRLEAATVRAGEGDLDGALLATRLGPDDAWSLADVLRSNNVPFAFVTAGSCSDLPARFRDVACLQKPYRDKDLRNVMAALFAPPTKSGATRPAPPPTMTVAP